jgi:hypothetical protein
MSSNAVTESKVVSGDTVTLCTLKPGRNGGIWWKYVADNLGLTVRSGEIACSWDVTDNITQDFDESTLDNVDYLTAPGACVIADSGTGSTCTNGDHIVKVTFYTAIGETELGTASNTLTLDGADDITVTEIPISTDPACTGRYLYMTEASGSTYYRTTTIANNIDTTATISVDDTALALLTGAPTANTTALANSTGLTFDTSMSAGVVSLTATSTEGDWNVLTGEICRLIKHS